jgi:hypothetical protein
MGSFGLRLRGSRGLGGFWGVGFSSRFGQNSMVMVSSPRNEKRRQAIQ